MDGNATATVETLETEVGSPSVVDASPGSSAPSADASGADGLAVVMALAGLIVLACLATLVVVWRRRRLHELGPPTPEPRSTMELQVQRRAPAAGARLDEEEGGLAVGIGYARFPSSPL